MGNVNLTIDGRAVSVDKGSTVLEAARKAGVRIPTLCYLENVQAIGACRMCIVEVQGKRGLHASCVLPVEEGMVVNTNTAMVRTARKAVMELILSNHPFECLTCVRNLNCELQRLAEELGVRQVRFQGANPETCIDDSNPSVIRDQRKCILCRRCVTVCKEIQGVSALGMVNRGFETRVAAAGDVPLGEVACALCGQCIQACPVGALYEPDKTGEVWRALADPNKHVVVQPAPAIRVALGEEVGMPVGSVVTGKMATALRMMGFDAIFDTDFAADLTIIEEGHELLHRMQNGGVLPMITSCSPGWIKFCEHFYPDLLPNLSTCKSPHEMLGALAKGYYAEKIGKKPEDIFVVSIMPCTAKKFEVERPEMASSGQQDVDVVLTTRELGRMIREAGIDFPNLEDGEFDAPLGISTGAALIFGASGGVMEAALRTVYEVVAKEPLANIDFCDVRGLEGVKEATVDIKGTKVRVAVTNGLANARKVLDAIKDGTGKWDFIEIMACPGGCIGGGGQPQPTNAEVRKLRMEATYRADCDMPIRKSHENPGIKKLYDEFLIEPLGEKSHHLLHTHYCERGKYQEENKCCK